MLCKPLVLFIINLQDAIWHKGNLWNTVQMVLLINQVEGKNKRKREKIKSGDFHGLYNQSKDL